MAHSTVIVVSLLIFVFVQPILVKAINEYYFSRTVTIDLRNGTDQGMAYWANVDRDDYFGHYAGQWLGDSIVIGQRFYDKTVNDRADEEKYNAEHVVENNCFTGNNKNFLLNCFI